MPEKVSIFFGTIPVYKGKSVNDLDLEQLRKYLQESEITIRVSLDLGKDTATVWGM